MIKKIAHRINNLNDLKILPQDWGIELDVHAYENNLVVVHDAFCNGIKLEEFLEYADGRFLAVNIKEEGIEKKTIEILKNMNFSEFFLFDISFPQIYRLGSQYSNNLAIRISQLEKINFEECRKYAQYVWIDTFDGKFWMEDKLIIKLKELYYRLCFVSPELHRPPLGAEDIFIENINKYNLFLGEKDLICTKYK